MLTEASKYNLSDYYAERLEEKKKLFKKIPFEEIMKWTPCLISEPLTKMPEYLNEHAVKMFKRLSAYMGDRKSVKSQLENAKSHLELSFKGTEDLKDEAFVQVLKQIKDHPD